MGCGEVPVSDKEQIRRDMLAEQRRRESVGYGDQAALGERLAALPGSGAASALAAYMAIRGEVDLTALIRARLQTGLPVWLPRFSRHGQCYEMVLVRSLVADVVPGAFGILEPRAELPAVSRQEQGSEAVVWLVPGLAFDLQGQRLGRGRGYYDRLLDGTRGVRVGVAWDWQVLKSLPHAAHDVAMDWVVTDTRTIACDGALPAQAE
jgi:5-formyltetrahydrofolate cyclo-ligase